MDPAARFCLESDNLTQCDTRHDPHHAVLCTQFGPGKMQQHGFARNLDWSIASTSANPNPDLPDPTVSPQGAREPLNGWPPALELELPLVPRPTGPLPLPDPG